MNGEPKTEGLLYGWDGKDWRTYKWTMRAIFREHGLLDLAEGKIDVTSLGAESKEAYDKKQYKILRMIGTTIPSHRLQQLDQHERGSEMWAALCEIYERRQDPMIKESIILRKSEELRDMKCAPSRNVELHLTKMVQLRTELNSYGYDVNPINMRAMMLDSLPDQYEYEQLRGAVKYVGSGGSMGPESLRVLIEQAAERQARRKEKTAQGSGGIGGGGRTSARNTSGRGPRGDDRQPDTSDGGAATGGSGF